MNAPLRDYPHPQLDSEVTAIGGHYIVTKEDRLSFQGEDVLYSVGKGIVDRTCCGFGAFCFASVAGFVRQWQYRRNDDDQPVSRVEPVTNTREQEQIRKLIKAREAMVSQVNFMPP